MKLRVTLAVVGLGFAGLTVAFAADPVQVREPLPFDHADHAEMFARKGVTCIDCHPVGLMVELAPPRSTCHGCHLREVAGSPKRIERGCWSCHPPQAALAPMSHGPGWVVQHGSEARRLGARCADCHDAQTCVDCHDGRGALAMRPHEPGFLAVHGVEARVDPASCTSCHTGDTCATCHRTGGPVR